MDRKLISRRIGSILDDISRLSNALYAMDTTDIQRYPDNYETLSTDAALRAERIACRLRHLIYSSTTIRKGDYPCGAAHQRSDGRIVPEAPEAALSSSHLQQPLKPLYVPSLMSFLASMGENLTCGNSCSPLT